MNWNAELAYDAMLEARPRCGRLRTLRDANYALLDDLGAQCRYRGHWSARGRLLLAAANRGGRLDVMLATDALVMALKAEGWMTPTAATGALFPHTRCGDALVALTLIH